MTRRLSVSEARRWVATAQGLHQQFSSVEEVLENTGFLRTLGGIEVYLALKARIQGFSSVYLDSDVSSGVAQVVPAVRGCIYLVGRSSVPLVLRIADLQTRNRAQREHDKAGIQPGEVEKVAEAVLELLSVQAPLTTDGIRRNLPEATLRSLGAAGKKVGITSTLPPALRRLEFEGRISRRPESSRLDTERYVWFPTARNPFEEVDLPEDEHRLHALLAKTFFRAAGLGTLMDFCAWSGLSQRSGRAAIDLLDLKEFEIESISEPHLCLAECEESLSSYRADAPLAFLPFEDNVIALHGGPALFVDSTHGEISVPSWGSSTRTPLREARHLFYRTCVASGEIVGFWEFEPESRSVKTFYFKGFDSRNGSEARKRAVELGTFISLELGHGRSYSLDTDAALTERTRGLESLKP